MNLIIVSLCCGNVAKLKPRKMKNQEITVSGKKFIINSIGKMFAGYGHNNVTCQFQTINGQSFEHTVKTNNTRLTDRMEDDNEEIENEARLEAAEMVISGWLESIA